MKNKVYVFALIAAAVVILGEAETCIARKRGLISIPITKQNITGSWTISSMGYTYAMSDPDHKKDFADSSIDNGNIVFYQSESDGDTYFLGSPYNLGPIPACHYIPLYGTWRFDENAQYILFNCTGNLCNTITYTTNAWHMTYRRDEEEDGFEYLDLEQERQDGNSPVYTIRISLYKEH